MQESIGKEGIEPVRQELAVPEKEQTEAANQPVGLARLQDGHEHLNGKHDAKDDLYDRWQGNHWRARRRLPARVSPADRREGLTGRGAHYRAVGSLTCG